MGSGRVVVDNKGNVVKQYEPFFSGSSEFTPETELTEWGVTPLFFYDPVGRNTRVELPDDSVRTWVFNPWRLESKDEEDNKSGGDHENTPTITHLDAQGRVFQTDAYLVNQSTATSGDILSTSVELDVQGNPVTVTDPRGNDIQEQTFDLLGRPLFTGSADEGYTGSNDTGETRILPDVAGQVVQTWRSHDASNELVLTRTFDTLRRPVQLSVTDDGGTTTRLVEYRLYGEFDGGSGTKAKGRLWRLYDTAGELELTEYDFKGNLLEMSKTLPDDFTADEDWTGIAAETNLTDLNTFVGSKLSGDTYTLERTFDALNRLLTETGPDAEIGGSGAASVTTYGYDKGSRLKTVDITVRGGSSTPIVSDITYNARGQRLTIVKGDDGTATKFATTTYTYDADRLWLKTLTTLRDGDTASQDELQLLTYTRDLVGNITEIDDEAQSNHYHNNTQVNRTRTFSYDALYRLTEATGREKDALAQLGPSLPSKYAVPAPGAQDALMRNYTQTYFYDEAGNLTEMKHVANSTTQWRRGYDLATGNNQLLKSSEPGDTFGTPSTYSSSYAYNRRGAMVFLPHLYNNAGADNLERDYRDQLRKAILNANDDAFYVYDAAGNRVAKYVEGGQNRYVTLYLWGYEVYQEIDSTGPTVKEERHTIHVMDDVNRVCLIESRTVTGSSSYTHTPTPLLRFQFDDHLGTACVETDVDMAVISYEEYHPYGTTAWWASNAAVDKRYRFTGKERDEETGLSYHGQRYLITWLGRWERADPIGLGDGGNRHGYAQARPSVLRDPSGLAGGGGLAGDRTADLIAGRHPGSHPITMEFQSRSEAYHSLADKVGVIHPAGDVAGAAGHVVEGDLGEAAVDAAGVVPIGEALKWARKVPVVRKLTQPAVDLADKAIVLGKDKATELAEQAYREFKPVAKDLKDKAIKKGRELSGKLDEKWRNWTEGDMPTAGPPDGSLPAEVVEASKEADLHRPYIRKPVRAEVEARAPRDASGRPIDPNTGAPIEGKPDLGHKPGHEFRREKAAAEAEGLTQQEFNDKMNDPDLYQLEDPSSNRSHKYEQKP